MRFRSRLQIRSGASPFRGERERERDQRNDCTYGDPSVQRAPLPRLRGGLDGEEDDRAGADAYGQDVRRVVQVRTRDGTTRELGDVAVATHAAYVRSCAGHLAVAIDDTPYSQQQVT